MDRTSSVTWFGSEKEGKGHISTTSGVLDEAPYSFHTRFEDGIGTNPEELIAAAHAACFTMKLSFLLAKKGFKSEMIETSAKVTLEKDGIGRSHLTVRAKIPEIHKQVFEKLANDAKKNCIVSRALKTKITMDAELIQEEVAA